jgi:ATP/maltotriose-dependent transcriptional regulator MalT
LPRLASDHPLSSRANALLGQGHFFLADFTEAQSAFETALATALDGPDEAEALHGMAVAKSFGEHGDPSRQIAALEERRYHSPQHLIRFTTAELSRRRYAEGLRDLRLAEAEHSLRQVEDPRVRTAFTYTVANLMALRAQYTQAGEYFELFRKDVEAYELEFAIPFLGWTAAFIALGLRRFGETDRHLQKVEDWAMSHRQPSHEYNARILRARLLLETGQAEEACDSLRPEANDGMAPAWRGEYHATQALALACLGDCREANELAEHARSETEEVAVRVLAQAARAVACVHSNGGDEALELMRLARQLDVWDPVVVAARSSERLANFLAQQRELRFELGRLYQASNDSVLARNLGVRQRSTRAPEDILSPRELEVLGLMAAGLRNREIGKALFIAESTVKVHVRHILERLGVRTRAEAVARFERLARSS